ncbi:MAG: hypothetical protein ACRDZT_02075 [Acidimicrobiales bacterium]
MGIVRVFYPGLPGPWSGPAGVARRPVVVSFNARPELVLSGRDNARLLRWFETAPRGRDVYWCYYHEPEDNIAARQFTAAEYRAAWQKIAGLAASARNPHLHATLILMGFTLSPHSHRNWRSYYPGSRFVQYIGWDAYNPVAASRRGTYETPSSIYIRIVRLMDRLHKPWGIAETGSLLARDDHGSRRARWIRAVAGYLEHVNARWCTYFDANVGGNYQLHDAYSVDAWRAAVIHRIRPS